MANPFDLIKKHVPSLAVNTIFDIGANKGDTVWASRIAFPNAAIYAFEPMPSVYAELARATERSDRIHIYNMALGREQGSANMNLAEDPTMNKVQTTDGPGLIKIQMSTVDSFCVEKGIKRIDFMKIDTEGFDLEVILGAKDMLQETYFLQCEVSANPHNTFHIHFRPVYDHLVDLNNFSLFHILDQVMEWGGKPVLRRFDAVFINNKIARLNER